MDPMTIGLLAGAGTGLVKGAVLDPMKEKRQRQMEAEIARYSPWTGMQAQRPQQSDALGSTLQGGMAGASMGQNYSAWEGMQGGEEEAASELLGTAPSANMSQMPQQMGKKDQLTAMQYPWSKEGQQAQQLAQQNPWLSLR